MDRKTTLENQKWVGDGLKYVREGRILELSALPLAQTSLVTDCFLSGHPITPDSRGRTLRSILRWGVDRLKPGGAHSWYAIDWRNYNTLNAFYLEGLKVVELAEKMGVSVQTLYSIRSEAVAEATKVLIQEIEEPADAKMRKYYALEDQYKLHTPVAQKILRLLTTFKRSMPHHLILAALKKREKEGLNSALSELVNSGMVISGPSFSTVLVHPETTDFLTFQVRIEERAQWCDLFGSYFLEKRQYLDAAMQYLTAGFPQKSAEIIVKHAEGVTNDLQMEDLQQIIDRFDQSDLKEETWIRIQLISGDNLKMLGNLDQAISAYQKGLAASTVELKAEAYYKRAMALFLTNLDEALAHYDYCIQLLSKTELNSKLLTRAYIGRAQVLLRENRLDEAEESLKDATSLDEEDRDIFSYLQSAWYYLSIKQNNLKKAAHYGQQAWLAANELADSVRMAEMSHNLGMIYARMDEFEKSRDYLYKSTVLAKEIGNLEIVALNHLTLGGLHFVQKGFQTAIREYFIAWEMFAEMGNLNWQTHTAYNLAEAYGALDDEEQFWKFYHQGIELAQKTSYTSMTEEITKLKVRFGYEDLYDNLNERQLFIIKYLKTHDHVTNREYQTLTEVSSRQSLRDLQELVSRDLIKKEGKGRSVKYRSIEEEKEEEEVA